MQTATTLFGVDDDADQAAALAHRILDGGGGHHIGHEQADGRLRIVTCSCGKGNRSWASNRRDAWSAHIAHLNGVARRLQLAGAGL